MDVTRTHSLSQILTQIDTESENLPRKAGFLFQGRGENNSGSFGNLNNVITFADRTVGL
jgi:hypothetical protein